MESQAIIKALKVETQEQEEFTFLLRQAWQHIEQLNGVIARLEGELTEAVTPSKPPVLSYQQLSTDLHTQWLMYMYEWLYAGNKPFSYEQAVNMYNRDHVFRARIDQSTATNLHIITNYLDNSHAK